MIGLPELVFLVFLVLKLTGVIAWSWWWVASPLLIEAGFGFIILVASILVAAVGVRR